MDAFQQAQATELLQTTMGGCIISAAFADIPSRTPGALEAGSAGHGPRKEFFLLAGQGMLEQPAGLQQEPEIA